MIILLINQWLVRYHVIIIIGWLNTLLYYSSYKREYKEWKKLFSWGIIISILLWMCYARWSKNYDQIMIIGSIGGLALLWIYYSIPYLFTITKDDTITIQQQQEITLYICFYILLYWIFSPNYSAIIVTQLWFTTGLIAIRQNYLTTKNTVLLKKKDWLSWRSLLAWQKVLERYDHNTKSFSISFFTSLINNGYMPSAFGMFILQYIQLISIIILVIISIVWILHNQWYTLIWYRLGILCFITTLFWVQSQERFISYYKPIALILLTWAYYITLLDNTHNSSIFTRWSLIWLCINMITCLYQKELFPKSQHLFSRKDILFWLSIIIISSIITIISLIWLPLAWDVLFALWCIIIGMVSFFWYHIWRNKI
jgi:hypothetical protein